MTIERLDYDEQQRVDEGQKVFSEKEEGSAMIEKFDCDM